MPSTLEQFNRTGASELSLALLNVTVGAGLLGEFLQEPVLPTSDGAPVYGTSSIPVEERFAATEFIARQYYERTDLKFNNAPVWRGITDPNWWIIRGKAPYAINTFECGGKTMVIADPTHGSTSLYTDVWKIVERAGPEFFDAPPQKRDFYRCSIEGVDQGAVRNFGIIPGGPHPATGTYISEEVTGTFDEINFDFTCTPRDYWDDRRVQVKRTDLCEEECFECRSFPIWNFVSPFEFFIDAENKCLSEGLSFHDSVLYPIQHVDQINGEVVYRGYTCCK
jgi:hypothetical protein